MIYLGICLLSILVGIFIGYLIMAHLFRCGHTWEKIIDTFSGSGRKSRVVVYMCMKCGKRKVTKI